MRATLRVAVLGGFCALGAAAEPVDPAWNQWRGPLRDGAGTMFGELADWSQAPQKVWDVEVGVGHASPVIHDGSVFLIFRNDGHEVAAAFELDDGAQRWSQRYPVSFRARMGGKHHGAGPKATPVVADGKLVTFGITGILTAWNTEDGAQLWQVDFGKELEDPFPTWGTSLSPLMHDGKVIVHFGHDDGSLLALDAATGKELWRYGGGAPGYGSPILTEIAGQTQIVTLAADGVWGVDLDGKLLWSHDFPMNWLKQNVATPVVQSGKVIFSGEKRPLMAIEPKLEDGTWQVATVWERRDLSTDMSTVVPVGERICGLTHLKKGQAFCVEAATGKTIWMSPARFAEHASLVTVPGAVLYLLSDANLVALDATSPTYRELARHEVANSETWAHPAVLERGLIIKSFDRLLRLDFDGEPGN